MDTNSDAVRAGIPLDCTLATEAAVLQKLEWTQLRDHATEVVTLDAGVRMTFPASMAPDIEDLARRESACCSVLSISTSVGAGVQVLEITTVDPELMPVISAIAEGGLG